MAIVKLLQKLEMRFVNERVGSHAERFIYHNVLGFFGTSGDAARRNEKHAVHHI